MTAPNIKNPDIINGRTARHAVTGTLESALDNAADSNRVLKINSIFCANVDGVASADISISLYDGVNDVYIAKTVTVPAKSTQILSTKDTYFYIEESKAIRAIASVAGDLELVISYEEIGDALVEAANADADTYFYSNSLLLYGNGEDASTAIVDSSSNARVVNVNGDAQISTTESKFGGSSMYFDGSGDYLTSPASTDFSFDGDFTIELWIKTSTFSLSGYYRRVVATGPDDSTAIQLLFFNGAATPNISVRSYAQLINGTIPAATGDWVHVALTRSGSSMKLFVNGTQSGSTSTVSTAFTRGATSGLTVGRYYLGNGYFDGYMQDLRITKGVARYTADFTPPTESLSAETPGEPYLFNDALLLSGDGTNGSTAILDSSSSVHVVTANGDAQISTAESKFGGSSLYFDGSGDYLTIPASSDFDFGTGDFTVEFWIFRTALVNYATPISHNYGTNPNFLIQTSTSLGQRWRLFLNGLGVSITEGSDHSLNTWYHYAIVRNGGGTNNVVMYRDGISVATGTFTGNVGNASVVYAIGGRGDGTLSFAGYIDDLRITKGVARYTANFTPPTESLSTLMPGGDQYYFYDTLLLSGDGEDGSTAILDSSSNAHVVTANGNAQISTTESKFGGSSLYFDGSGDSLTVPDSSDWHFGSDDFTIEAWIYPTAITNLSAVIVCQWGNTGSSGTWAISMPSTSSVQAYFSSGTAVNSPYVYVTAPCSFNQWQHIAAVRNGTTLSIYANGTLAQTATISFAVADAPEALSIGRQLFTTYRAGEPYQGYIDDFRITKGVARYTANFTPPTEPF